MNLGIFNTQLRAGYALSPSPKKVVIDRNQDKETISGGLSIGLDENVNLEVTLLRNRWSRYSADIYTPGGVSENIYTNHILIGFSYSF